MHDTLGHGKTQGSPCVLHRRPLRPSRFARIRRRRSAIAWRDTPNSRATAAWPASSTSSAHSRRVACSSASSREMRPSSECRCRFSVVVRSLRGRGTHSGYPPRCSTKGILDRTLHLLGPERYLEQRLAAARWRVGSGSPPESRRAGRPAYAATSGGSTARSTTAQQNDHPRTNRCKPRQSQRPNRRSRPSTVLKDRKKSERVGHSGPRTSAAPARRGAHPRSRAIRRSRSLAYLSDRPDRRSHSLLTRRHSAARMNNTSAPHRRQRPNLVAGLQPVPSFDREPRRC